MRGQPHRQHILLHRLRIIPARAGPTLPFPPLDQGVTDHPRSCGANICHRIRLRVERGSSPLVRGQPPRYRLRRIRRRIIPARAGPTSHSAEADRQSADHPRSCGANLTAVTGTSIISGSSPLVRGQHQHDLLPTPFLRIIPARAGPTWRRTQGPRAAADHPRSCGANHLNITPRVEQFGSSPLVRGQQFIDVSDSFECRIIPARAGPTMFVSSRAFSNADHPRSCGANTTRRPYGQYAGGSSPLVRGQLGACDIHVSRERIIPARAGPTRINPCH